MLEPSAAPHMAYRRRKAEAEITGLERPINDHLLKLRAVRPDGATQETRRHWRRELLGWLDDLAHIRLEPAMRPGSARFYFDILFNEPFEGAERENVGRRLHRIAREEYALRDDAEAATLADLLRTFHAACAAACAPGEATPECVERLLREVAGPALA